MISSTQYANKQFEDDCEIQFDRDEGFDDNMSNSSVKTNHDVVLLWDILKSKFRKSEEEEVSRIIGRDLIQKGEDLRSEYNTFLEIYQEIQETQSVARAKQEIQDNLKKSNSLFSSGGNAKFLNQELQFFIENLQQKAVDSGLDENSLIPKANENDKKMFDYINHNVLDPNQMGRPQSALTGLSSASKMSNSLIRDCDPAGIDQTMRSSFYSTKDGFMKQKNSVVDSLKVKNVLELSEDDMLKIEKIRDFMQEQLNGLDDEIKELQKMIMDSQMSDSKKEKESDKLPTQKELKDYTAKLQDEFLKSDQSIKVQKALNTVSEQSTINKPSFNRTASGLKLSIKNSSGIGSKPIKVPQNIIDKESPMKEENNGMEGKKIIRMTMKRGDSKSKLVKIRQNSQTKRIVGGGTSQIPHLAPSVSKLKLKISAPIKQQIPISTNAAGAPIKMKKMSIVEKPKVVEEKPDLYGLDSDMIEMLGLGEYLDDSDDERNKKSDKKKEEDPSWNMSYEEMRQQFDIDGQQKHVNKLRKACSTFKDVE